MASRSDVRRRCKSSVIPLISSDPVSCLKTQLAESGTLSVAVVGLDALDVKNLLAAVSKGSFINIY